MFDAIHFLHCGCMQVASSYSCVDAWALVVVSIGIAAVGALMSRRSANKPA